MRILGHMVHPMLIVFPLGLLATAVAFDIVAFSMGQTSWYRMSFWMIAAGILGGLLAAIFGLMDWIGIPSGTRAKAIGLWHGLINVVVVLLFIGSWLLRRPIPHRPKYAGVKLVISGSDTGAGQRLAGRRTCRAAWCWNS